MAPSIYSPLPKDVFTIRLLRLLPSASASSTIHCSLVTYPLTSRPSGTSHLYEALSYVWGSSEDPRQIFIDSESRQVTQNLHAALVQLRDPFFERVLWVDAVCINQNDDKEKAHQVGAMARIYGLAQRVVVWLGEARDGSALAFQELSEMALKSEMLDHHSDSDGYEQDEYYSDSDGYENDEHYSDPDGFEHDEHEGVPGERNQAVLSLLDRTYFRRIWVLQELAAARSILVKCGDSEIQGTTFRTGILALDLKAYDELPILQSRIRAVMSLLHSSSTRESLKGRAHLNIQPLAELVNMFHNHEATDCRDKIYALLGMCSDNEVLSPKLQPNYSVEWKELFEELVKHVFGETDYITASPEEEIVLFRSQGFVLGKVSEIASTDCWSDTQTARITSTTPFRELSEHHDWTVRCKFRLSARKIQADDLALLTNERKKLVIVRPEQYYFRVILVTDVRLVQREFRSPGHWVPWHPFLEQMDTFPVLSSLLWIWREESTQDEQEALLLARKEP